MGKYQVYEVCQSFKTNFKEWSASEGMTPDILKKSIEQVIMKFCHGYKKRGTTTIMRDVFIEQINNESTIDGILSICNKWADSEHKYLDQID